MSDRHKELFMVDGPQGWVVALMKSCNRGKKRFVVVLHSRKKKFGGEPLIFRSKVRYRSLKALKHALKSDESKDIAYNWMVRIAMEHNKCSRFEDWLKTYEGQMYGSGYMDSCTKYTPIQVVNGGLPS